jgi:hypothetical protein
LSFLPTIKEFVHKLAMKTRDTIQITCVVVKPTSFDIEFTQANVAAIHTLSIDTISPKIEVNIFYETSKVPEDINDCSHFVTSRYYESHRCIMIFASEIE